MTKPVFKRILAYLLDLIIVGIVATAISYLPIFNKQYEESEKVGNEITELLQELNSDPEKLAEFMNSDEYTDLLYRSSKASEYINLITLVVTLVYFVGFQYITKGRSAGKALMKLEIMSKDGSAPSGLQLFIRSLIINSVLCDFIGLLMIHFMSKGAYLKYYSIVQIVKMGLLFVTYGMIIYNSDGMSLHDKLAHTMVVYSSEKDLIIKSMNKRVKEAKIIEEKEIVEEEVKEIKVTPKKKATKKKTKKEE